MTLQQAPGYNPLTFYLVPLSKINPKLAECIYTFIVTFYIRMLDTCQNFKASVKSELSIEENN